MNLYFCLDCAMIYSVDPEIPKVCPKCDKLLGVRQEEPDKAATLSELTSRFLDHRPLVRGWATGGVVRPEQPER